MTRYLLAAAAAALLASPAAAQVGMQGSTDKRPLDTPATMGTGMPSPDSTDPTLKYSGTAAQRDAVAGRVVEADPMVPAEAAESASTDVSATTSPMMGATEVRTVTNGPVPDTRANRDKFGGPMSRAGKATTPRGN